MRTKSIFASLLIVTSLYSFSICKSWSQPLPKDTTAVDQLYQKSKEFWTANLDSAAIYLRQADELAKKSGMCGGKLIPLTGLE